MQQGAINVNQQTALMFRLPVPALASSDTTRSGDTSLSPLTSLQSSESADTIGLTGLKELPVKTTGIVTQKAAQTDLWTDVFNRWVSNDDDQTAIDCLQQLSKDDEALFHQLTPMKPHSELQEKFIMWYSGIFIDMYAEEGSCALNDMPFAGELDGGAGATNEQNALTALLKQLTGAGITVQPKPNPLGRAEESLKLMDEWKTQVVEQGRVLLRTGQLAGRSANSLQKALTTLGQSSASDDVTPL